jgi:hypothetical protein
MKRRTKVNLVKILYKLTGVGLLSLLVSCGGGGSGTVAGGVGTGGTGITWGTTSGFASLVVDGTDYSSATGEYWVGDDLQESAKSSAMAVKLGQQLRLDLDGQGNPSKVMVEPAMIGQVSAVNAGTFTVNGMTVKVNGGTSSAPRTYYAGMDGFNSISVGQQVEVHGLYGVESNGTDYILATRVELLPSSNTVTRITGKITHLDTQASTFKLDGITVQYDGSTSILPGAHPLSDGQLVNVWSPNALGGQTVHAQVVRIRTLVGTNANVVVSGLVASPSGAAFTVSGIPVDASAANVIAVARTLSLGEYVVVSGHVDTTTGVLLADQIRIGTGLSNAILLKGTITDFVSASNFQVRGTVVDAGAAQLTGGSAAQLSTGTYVDVQGQVVGNIVQAQSVTIHASTPDDRTVEYTGRVSQLNGSAFTLTTDTGQAYVVSLTQNVGYENGNASSLVNGVRVEIEATNTTMGLQAYGVAFLGTASVGTDELETDGIAYNVTATSFVVNNLTILINGQSAFGLVDGASVEVHFIKSNGQYLATEIDVAGG